MSGPAPQPRRPARAPAVLAAALVFAAGMLAGASLLASSVYALSRLLTDRSLATQFLFWTPAWAYLLAAVALATPALLADWARLALHRRRAAQLATQITLQHDGGRTPPLPTPALPRRSLLPTLAMLAAVGIAAHWLLIDLRLTRRLTHPKLAHTAVSIPTPNQPPTPGVLDVAHWNALSDTDYTNYTNRVLAYRRPDLLVMSGFREPTTFPLYVNSFGLTPEGTPHHFANAASFMAFSRWPIKSHRLFSLGLAGREGAAWTDDPHATIRPAAAARSAIQRLYDGAAPTLGLGARRFDSFDPGHLWVLQLDTTAALGKDLVVWYVDLPSNPLQERWEQSLFFKERVALLRHLRDPDTREPLAPPADIMMGDFNTPRGSASLHVLAAAAGPSPDQPLIDAFDSAGVGSMATFPRLNARREPSQLTPRNIAAESVADPRPSLHIDHLFAAPWLTIERYHAADLGSSEHLAIFAQLSARRPPLGESTRRARP